MKSTTFSTVTTCLVCILGALSATAGDTGPPGRFVGRLVEILAREPAPGGHDVRLRFASSGGDEIVVDDPTVVFMLESAHSVLMSDHVGSDPADLAVGVKFEGVTLRADSLDGRPARFLETVETVFPDHPDSETSFRYGEFDPGRPAADARHRYLEVPVSYQRPELGTFHLYYELSSDYDPARRTVLVPTDAQRSLSQVGWADRYREMFDLDANVVTFEFRGMPCSPIDTLEAHPFDWALAGEILGSDAVVEDIERIRADLLGERTIDVLGGSGTAMIGMKYVARYPHRVRRAYLMSFFKDARGSSEAGTRFFAEFLAEHALVDDLERALARDDIDRDQFLFLIQRLLYFDRDAVVELVREAAAGESHRFLEWTDRLGTVDFFVRSRWKYHPWTVVFMWETNIPTETGGMPDVNAPFLALGKPLAAVAGQPGFGGRLFDIEGLEGVETEVLLVAGSLDPVAPVEELERIHRLLPRSRLAVFEASHCLQVSAAERRSRNGLAGVFFASGLDSPALVEYLDDARGEGCFLYLADEPR